MAAYASLIPTNIITGFLGSGKTTLLNRLLRSRKLANTAVLINEFGEVGLDHLLLESIDAETVLLQSGCVCCTIRGDLADAMRALFDKRARGLVPSFDRLAIETTGLADPAPIVSTLLADPVLRHHFRLGSIVTTVDAANAALHLEDHPEPVRQAAVADRIVLTKTDLAPDGEVERLAIRLKALNPSADLIDAQAADFDPDTLLTADVYDPASRSGEVRRWLSDASLHLESHGHAYEPNRHARGIRSFCLRFEQPLDWTAFGLWLSMLLHVHGQNVLRVKGILNVLDVETPVVIHGVQHIVHPPAHLDHWPDGDRRSRIVFIVKDLEPALIERSLAAFNHLANPPGTRV